MRGKSVKGSSITESKKKINILWSDHPRKSNDQGLQGVRED